MDTEKNLHPAEMDLAVNTPQHYLK